MNDRLLIDCFLALLVLVNPVSKIFVISTMAKNMTGPDLHRIIIKASLIALGILLLFMLVGNFLLSTLFHVNIYAFKIAGGIVLLSRGYSALNKGLFFEASTSQKLEDMSIVPLASPMIAGPATMTASVSFPATYGLSITGFSIFLVVFCNLLIMLFAPVINRMLTRFNIAGALIRITGLIVATIGIQMMLDGISEYLRILFV